MHPVQPASGDEPRVFIVIDQGVKHGPLTRTELQPWYEKPCNVLFDTTQNWVMIRYPDEQQSRRVAFAQHRGQRGVSRLLERFRVMAEDPGRRFSGRVMGQHTGSFRDAKTFIRYVHELRDLLGDTHRRYPLILTDRGVDPVISPTRCAYCANPDLKWRVIRYVSPGCQV